jgi:hypothetical protein
MCYNMYAFFSHNSKKVFKYVNLAKTLETKDLKLLHNVKSHWILILGLLKWVLGSAFVTSCGDAHRCTKEQDCSNFLGSFM